MAKINEKQVVDFLNSRRQELQTELTKIETALSALQESEQPKQKYTRKVGNAQDGVKQVKMAAPKTKAKKVRKTDPTGFVFL